MGLFVKEKRPDGFHNLETIFYPVKICDILDVVSADGAFSFEQTGNTIDVSNEENICCKAWQLMKHTFPHIGAAQMHLHKLIPSGAGLGGGSADGAFALQSVNTIFALGLSDERLSELALELGSDCPFFLLNKPAYATGRGELLEPLALDLSDYTMIVVNPGIHVNTGEAFKMLQLQNHKIDLRDAVNKPVKTWKDFLINDFEAVVFKKFPAIAALKDSFYNAGALFASMSGTGSSCYGIFPADVNPALSLPAHYKIYRINN